MSSQPATGTPSNYRDRRDADEFSGYHEWTRNHRPGWVYPVFRVLMTLPMLALYRPRAVGIENMPTSGPVVLAVNHLTNLDHFFVGAHLRRHLNFMGKSQLFKGRLIGYILNRGGVFPIRRGVADEEAFATSRIVLDRGGAILMYPEGGRSRSGRPGRPRPGIGRIVLESGVPVVPVAVHYTGKQGRWRNGFFPSVTVAYGEPIYFEKVDRPDREQQQDVATRSFDEVVRQFDEIDSKGRAAFTREHEAKRRDQA